MRIGVFDSGIGGKSVAIAIQQALPKHEIIFRDDSFNLPYGTKTISEIRSFVTPILQDLAPHCDIIVIACNTVSTNLIKELRHKISVPLIVTEPMVKQAIELTKSKVIAVCATPRTLESSRYGELKAIYAKGIKVIEPDCSDWTSLIEANQMNQERINKDIEILCRAGADVIALGCTHYHWIEEEIKHASKGRAEVLQPEMLIIDELKSKIEQLS
ncbi:MAG: aspartate/glutamate racemase family protein [Patescibacteria group bacterium]